MTRRPRARPNWWLAYRCDDRLPKTGPATLEYPGKEPHAGANGDLYAVNVLDLANANNSRDTASILLGVGYRTFAAAAAALHHGAGRNPVSVAIGNLNGD